MANLPHEFNVITQQIIGAAVEVHRQLGPGFLESVYEEALRQEFELRSIQYLRQMCFAVDYKGLHVGEGRVDFLVANSVIVELKAVEALAPIHTAQVISYLKATRVQLGLLINFNVPILKHGLKRIILTDHSALLNSSTPRAERFQAANV
jgi:GxxExxY protein